jgi:murein L,D-transpeptidase YcbB/YkuD
LEGQRNAHSHPQQKDKAMKKLMLAGVSALALGVAGIGIAPAHATAPNQKLSSTNRPATATNQNQEYRVSQGAGMDQSTQPMQNGEQAGNTAVNNPQQLKQVQQQLKQAGLYKGKIDGKYGDETKDAVRDFQQQKGLQPTGRLDQQTMAALQGNGTNESGGSAVNPGAAEQSGPAGMNGLQNNNPPNQDMQQQPNATSK